MLIVTVSAVLPVLLPIKLFSETVAIELALQTLENMYNESGLTYDGYKEILKDLETIYTNPVETYCVYQEYGIFDKED